MSLTMQSPWLIFIGMASLATFFALARGVHIAAGYCYEMIRTDLPPSVAPHVQNVRPEPRSNRSVDVTILVIVSGQAAHIDYGMARNVMECYAATHGYGYRFEVDTDFPECGHHKDKFFRRHCIAHGILKLMPKESWLLFLDADTAVVNPNRLIEEFIDDRFDVTLYDRFYNWEVAAGSYLIRNTPKGLNFLTSFMDYEWKLPHFYHGTDNGAIHMLLMDLLAPAAAPEMTETCDKIWNTSRDDFDLVRMEACTILVYGTAIEYPAAGIRILPKGKGWMRDRWLLQSRFAQHDDFMLHGYKAPWRQAYPEGFMDKMIFFYDQHGIWHNWILKETKWIAPIVRELDIEKCKAHDETWSLERRLIVRDDVKKTQLDRIEMMVEWRKYESTSSIWKYV